MIQTRRSSFIVTPFLVLIAGLIVGAGAHPAYAAEKPVSESEFRSLKEDLKGIRGDLEELKKEMKLIRQLLGRRSTQTAPVVATVSVSGNPIMGRKDAPVTLIEFSDYQCPFCRRFSQNTLPTLKTKYIDTGRVRYVFRDFPLDRIHPQARKAAEAAHCAEDQGKYWEMHDLLFQNQKDLQVGKLKTYARSLKLDPVAFDDCLQKDKYAANVQKDLEDGVGVGIRGTPSFFVGKTGQDDTIKGVMIRGARPITVFQAEINKLLKEN